MVMMMLVVMIMAAAGAVRAVVMMMFVFLIMIVVVMMLALVVMVMVVMFAFLVMIVVMMMFAFVIMIMVVMMFAFIIFIVVVMMFAFIIFIVLVPFRRDDRCRRIQLPQTLHGIIELRFRQTGSMAQDQAACIGDLVVEEFTEILLIHLAFFRIDNRGEAVQLHIMHMQILHSADDVAQLADARRLDQNAVGVIFLEHLLERLAEISHKATADAAGVHLIDLDACFFQESAVNADLTEFVFDQHEFFTLIAVLDQLLDQRGLARAEEAGKNGNLGHDNALLSMKLLIAADFSAYEYIIAHSLPNFNDRTAKILMTAP